MRRLMVRVWKGEAPLARAFLFLPLFVISRLYGACLAAREFCYARGIASVEEAAVPVVSVGNLALGGTGKTPVVERLARELKGRGLRPGIVMLGYGRDRTGTFAVDGKRETAASAGDEALMLARRTGLPVLVAKRRSEAIERGIRDFGIDVAILDDGGQVRNVRRDVQLLVVSGQAPSCALHLFPLGVLREPLEMVRKADIILINKGEPDGRTKALISGMAAFRVRYRPLHLCRLSDGAMVDYRLMRGRRVLAFSGLGDNRSFFGLLSDIGADLARKVEFPDHYRYRESDLARLASFPDIDMVVTTEKDAVRIEGMEGTDSIFYLSIEADFDDADALVEQVCARVRA